MKEQVESHRMLEMLTCVDEKQINPHVTSLVLQVGGESNEVTPVRTIVLLLQMTLQQCCSWLAQTKKGDRLVWFGYRADALSLSRLSRKGESYLQPTMGISLLSH